MIPILVIEDEDRDYEPIETYIGEFKRSHRLSDDDMPIVRIKTYEEAEIHLQRIPPDQAVLWIIDIRLPRRRNSDEIITALLNAHKRSADHWAIIIYSVFARDYHKRRDHRTNVEVIHKLEDPPDAPSARMKLRRTIHQYLAMLIKEEGRE